MSNLGNKKTLGIKNTLRVALYVRVSTAEQATEGYSINEQIERLQKYCEAMKWEIYKIYVDPGYSGGDTNRPGLKDMIKDVESGEVDKVIVYKLDRLSRSQLDTLYLIEKVFLANNTDFISMSENFDTSTPFGRAVIGILAVFAQLEREQIKERMGMGKEARAKEGKWHGGSTEPVGYDYNVSDDMLYINEYEAMQIRELYDLFLKGTPLRTIETMFLKKGYKHKHGSWDPKTMRRVMANRVNIGYIRHKDQWYKGLHESLVDEETFNRAVELLNARAEKFKETGVRPGAQTTYLGGLLYCKQCGGKFSKTYGGSSKYGIKYYYSCYSRNKRMKKMIKDPNCMNRYWKMEELDNIIFDEIKKLSIDRDYINQIRREKEKQITEPNKADVIKKEINNLDEQISRFMDLYGAGVFSIEQIKTKVNPLNEQREKLMKELDKIISDTGAITDEQAFDIIDSFGDILERGDFHEIRSAIESLIDFIELDNDDITIHWKFA